MNEFFNLAAKIAYDNRVAAKQASDTWNKIKAAASKAGAKAKTIAKDPHFQKGAASAATGTVAGIIGKKSGMSGKGALGLGVGVAAGTDAALEGGSALHKKLNTYLGMRKLSKQKPVVEGEYSPVPGAKKVKGSNILVPQELSDYARGGVKPEKKKFSLPENGDGGKDGPRQ